jgi:hypothetical protein
MASTTRGHPVALGRSQFAVRKGIMEPKPSTKRGALGSLPFLLIPLLLTAGTSTAPSPGVRGVLTNIRVTHDRYPAHVEPFLAVNPRNSHNLLGVSQLIVPDSSDTLGTFFSFNDGRTWHDNGPLPLPFIRASGTDVTVAFGARGAGFTCATALGGSGANSRGVYIWRTDNGGRSFHPPVAVVRGDDLDHPWLASDPAKKGLLYVVWGSSQGLGFSRSLDGGRAFSRPRFINGGGDSEVPVLATGPHGKVYASYESGGGGSTDSIKVVTSRDQGLHFGRPVRLTSVPPEIEVGPRLQLPTSPAVATDPRTGEAYVAYAARPRGSARSDILVAPSHDSGRTWESAVRLTHEHSSTHQYAFQPQMAVDATGAVDVSYLELLRGHVDLFLERSTPGSPHLAFGRAQRITTRSFNPARGLPHSKHGRWWIGDYQGLAAEGGTIHPFWNDTRTGHLEIFTASLPVTTGR